MDYLRGQNFAANDCGQGIKAKADKSQLNGQQNNGQIPICPVAQQPKMSVSLE